MTPRIVALIVSGALNLTLLFVGTWLFDKLARERRRSQSWQEEAAFWQARAQRGVWHTCGCKKDKEHTHVA